jgi:hypothetical protein
VNKKSANYTTESPVITGGREVFIAFKSLIQVIFMIQLFKCYKLI